ncbi:MAG: bifunctional adenosylcobinamide kinase/adenosylcobinamide-phosphate guanylyltransferase [bacterium]|nr:bifunctional adenosylcobinamide kinase/adenosylcobinamide-phosphate guanylyltransferase [bacterium]
MGTITFITGGARSGKSRLAEKLLDGEDSVLYVATSIPFDDEMKDRVAQHRARRNEKWETLEAYRDLGNLLPEAAGGKDFILLDCVTIMVTNLMLMDRDIDWDRTEPAEVAKIENEIFEEINSLINFAEGFTGNMIIVSNELGMGLVPPAPLSRYYRDIAGRMNQEIARAAEDVYFTVSGIPVKVK